MKIPQSFIDQLKDRFLLSDIIGRRIPVKRAGREFSALCPFHKEKSPSFTINDAKGFYHCFGCGAHGDAITFLKDYEKIHYIEAVEKLAAEAGLAMPQATPEEKAREKRVLGGIEAMEAACRWFVSQLQGASGMAARQYLDQRGLSDATRKTFRIGFAPASREVMKAALVAQGFHEKLLVEMGLLIALDSGQTPYARFRERLMFPIRDRRGRVIGFGGRLLPGADDHGGKAPKYLNSPETELFHKGQNLFNLDLARRAAVEAGTILVGEGYMDVIALHQAGFGHAVAPLGTAITEQQLQLLWQSADEPVLCLDGDAAGTRAAMRAAELCIKLLKPGKSLRFARLPKGEDPDSLLKAQGAEAMQALVSQAIDLSELLWQESMRGATTPAQKAASEQRLKQWCMHMPEGAVRSQFDQFFRNKLREAAKPVWNPIKRQIFGKPAAQQLADAVSVPSLPSVQDENSRQDAKAMQLLRLLVLYPALYQDEAIEQQCHGIELSHPAYAPLLDGVLAALSEEPLERAGLATRLQSDGYGAPFTKLLAANVHLPPRLMRDETGELFVEVQRLWPPIWNEYQLERLQRDLREAQASFASHGDEASYARLMGLKEETERLIAQRRQFSEDELHAGE